MNYRASNCNNKLCKENWWLSKENWSLSKKSKENWLLSKEDWWLRKERKKNWWRSEENWWLSKGVAYLCCALGENRLQQLVGFGWPSSHQRGTVPRPLLAPADPHPHVVDALYGEVGGTPVCVFVSVCVREGERGWERVRERVRERMRERVKERVNIRIRTMVTRIIIHSANRWLLRQ